jgi:hypothetical protein
MKKNAKEEDGKEEVKEE